MTAQIRKAEPEQNASKDAARWKRFSGTLGQPAKPLSTEESARAEADVKPFAAYLKALIPPDPLRSDAIIEDRWRIGHERLQLSNGAPPWSVPPPSHHFADRVHRFDWLKDMIAHSDAGLNRACAIVDDWTEHFGQFHAFFWRLDPLTSRVWNWLLAGRHLFQTGTDAARQSRLDALHQQILYMQKTLHICTDPEVLWRAGCINLAYALVQEDQPSLKSALKAFEALTDDQLLADGGHISRSPQTLLLCLADMLVLQDLLKQVNIECPEFMQKWIMRMAAMVNFFKLHDGALAVFNNGSETRMEGVDAVLKASGQTPRNFMFTIKSGFHKLRKEKLTLMLDCGTAPPAPYATKAHAGPLGFEFTDGTARIVTSSGFSPEANLEWQAASRRTIAHSTLSLSGRDAVTFKTCETSQLLYPAGPVDLVAKRMEEESKVWLEAQHSGFKEKYGLIHKRRLSVSASGTCLNGEDSLVRPVASELDEDGKFIGFTLRFHLHPTVSAIKDNDKIYLRCENNAIWRFTSSHDGLQLENAYYLGRGVPEKSKQILITGRADPNSDGTDPSNQIQWTFERNGSVS